MIEWTAKNSSSFLNGRRQENTMIGAVRAARLYIENEMHGEGTVTFFEDDTPVRTDRKDLFTKYRWETKKFKYPLTPPRRACILELKDEGTATQTGE